MLKVIMLANSDYRHDARVQREAVSLSKSGYDVTVFSLTLTGQQEQHTKDVRLVKPTSARMAWFPYKFSYLKAYCQVLHGLLRENGDIWHGHDLDALPFMFIAAKIKGGKLVYDSHEFWQGYDWPGHGGRCNLARRLLWKGWLFLEKLLVKRCHLVITVNDSCAQEMAKALQVRSPLVLRNCVDPVVEESTSYPGVRERLQLSQGEPLVVYSGMVKKGRGLENLLKAWSGMPDGWHLAFVGDGTLAGKLRYMVSSTGHKNVHFLPPVEAWELPGFIYGASLGVVLTEDNDQSSRCSLPNKLFEYIAAGIPVLASNLPEIHRLVNKYEIGALANPRDHNSIRTALTELLANGEKLHIYRQNVQKARHDLSWQGEVSQLIYAYSKIVK